MYTDHDGCGLSGEGCPGVTCAAAAKALISSEPAARAVHPVGKPPRF